jgi:hypothetical protein
MTVHEYGFRFAFAGCVAFVGMFFFLALLAAIAALPRIPEDPDQRRATLKL